MKKQRWAAFSTSRPWSLSSRVKKALHRRAIAYQLQPTCVQLLYYELNCNIYNVLGCDIEVAQWWELTSPTWMMHNLDHCAWSWELWALCFSATVPSHSGWKAIYVNSLHEYINHSWCSIVELAHSPVTYKAQNQLLMAVNNLALQLTSRLYPLTIPWITIPHRINLWWPSTCHKASGRLTLYFPPVDHLPLSQFLT